MKKKFIFHVTIELNSLSSVPFVTGILFAKLKLLDGGKFKEVSTRQNINNHQASWEQKYEFDLLTVANKQGMLASRFMKVSIRKEREGGKSFDKLGFALVDLAEFAGAGRKERRYILNAHNNVKRRLDNSILKITVTLTLKSGDPLFKAPQSPDLVFSDTENIVDLISDSKSEKGDTLTRSAAAPVAAALNEVKNLERMGHFRTPSDDMVPSHIGKTRRSAKDVVDEILNSTADDLQNGEEVDQDSEAQPALHLYVSNDGTASLSNRRSNNRSSLLT